MFDELPLNYDLRMNIHATITALLLCAVAPSLAFCDSIKDDVLPTTRAEWRNLLKWDDACESGVAHIANSGVGFVGVMHFKMRDSSSLVSVVCRTGSFNQGKILFLLRKTGSGQRSKALVFPQFRYQEPKPDSSKYFDPNLKVPAVTVDSFYTYSDRLLWGNLQVDKEKRTITNNDFFRGGDAEAGTELLVAEKNQKDWHCPLIRYPPFFLVNIARTRQSCPAYRTSRLHNGPYAHPAPCRETRLACQAPPIHSPLDVPLEDA